MSVHQKVSNRVNRIKRGTPFSINGFYSLGSRTSVQKALSRLAKEGIIERVSKGFYARPKPLENIPSIKVTANAEQVAKSWAKENGYKLVPQGLEDFYHLGLQNQAPMKTIFWSNGPSRTFKIGNQVVYVRYTTENKLRWANKTEGTILRDLLSMSPASVGISELSIAFKRSNIEPSKVHQTIEKLARIPQLQAWESKFKTLKAQYA